MPFEVLCPVCKKSFSVYKKIEKMFCIFCGAQFSPKEETTPSVQLFRGEELQKSFPPPPPPPSASQPQIPSVIKMEKPYEKTIGGKEERIKISDEILPKRETGEISEKEIVEFEKEIEGNCPACDSEITAENTLYTCTICNKEFCNSCPSTHIPPENRILQAKVSYKYRVKGRTIWNSEITTFTDSLPEILCKNCYPKEFEKCIKRLKTKVTNWRVDQTREFDLKDVDVSYPVKKDDVERKKIIESAQELLKKLGKG